MMGGLRMSLALLSLRLHSASAAQSLSASAVHGGSNSVDPDVVLITTAKTENATLAKIRSSSDDDGLSLLQRRDAAVAALPGDNEASSTGAFRSVSSHVEELQAQLAQMQKDNVKQQAQRKSQYESELNNARSDNLKVATSNARLVQEIKDLASSAKVLRTRAFDLRQDVQTFHDDWESLAQNFSTAIEVTGKVLKGIQSLDQAPELHVLSELNSRDLGIGEAEKNLHRFDDILGALPPAMQQTPTKGKKASLLQVHIPAGTHSALLSALESGLMELTAENKQKLKELDSHYHTLLQEEATRHSGLLSEQKMLMDQKTSIQKLILRLESASMHLENLHNKTFQQASSVRAYFSNVGSRSLPVKNVAAAEVSTEASTTQEVANTVDNGLAKDPDEDVFNLDSLLVQASDSRPSPRTHASALEVSSDRPVPSTTIQQHAAEAPAKKEWLPWFRR